MEIYCVKEVEQNPVPKGQTKPFYIGTKDAPSDWVWYNIFLVTIISSEELIPQCDFKLPEICDDVKTCMSYGQDTFLLHSPQ